MDAPRCVVPRIGRVRRERCGGHLRVDGVGRRRWLQGKVLTGYSRGTHGISTAYSKYCVEYRIECRIEDPVEHSMQYSH
jgi:hypothetical protein